MKVRKSYIDIIKLIAMLFVFMIHTSDRFFLLFMQKKASVLYPLYVCIPHILKLCIPLFLMSTGALLLGKKEKLSAVLIGRVLKTLIILAAASAIMAVLQGESDIVSFLIKLYSSQYETTYWYLYMYLGLLLSLPFLRMLAEKMTAEHYIYMIVLYAVFSALKLVDFFVLGGEYALNNKLNVFLLAEYIFCPLTGYYIDTKADKKSCRLLALTGFIFFVISVAATIGYYALLPEADKGSVQHFFEPFAPLSAMLVFALGRLYIPGLKGKAGWLAGMLSAAVLYMMLSEGFFRSRLEFVFFECSGSMNHIFAVLVWMLAAYGAALAFSVLLYQLLNNCIFKHIVSKSNI